MKRPSLLPVSARKFLSLVEHRAKELSCTPFKACGCSKATWYRWKAGKIPVAVSKAAAVAQVLGLDENLFLSRDGITEALLAEKRNDLLKYRLLYSSYSKTSDNDGKAESMFQTARIIQSKLVLSGHNVLLSCEQLQEQCKTRLAVYRPDRPSILFITLFGENHEIFCVLENEEQAPVIGFSASNKNLRKLLKVLHRLFNGTITSSDLDEQARNLIKDLHV
jgi:hypothetical protein